MNKKVLTVQDISCFGQCSTTVALPILCACGVETAIMPSAILSTHTGGFNGFTFRDLTEDLPKIMEHWVKESISFDAIYTGYLGSKRQIEIVMDLFKNILKSDGIRIVDPAMADNGKLYTGFDTSFVNEMRNLIGIAIYEADTDSIDIFYTDRIKKDAHGTGDCYAAAFTGCLMQGKSLGEAVKVAAEFVSEAILKTMDDESHWYGVKFEKALPMLIRELNK